MGFQIAIDGPAGAGKSTIAKLVAAKLGFIYVDTGAMYRTLAVHFLKKGLTPEETAQIAEACADAQVEISYEGGVQQMILNGENVTSMLREEAVGNMASKCSAIPKVRATLLDLQRNLADTHNVVMDGRDIGTTVLPNANIKVFLTASSAVRARRRYLELKEKGIESDLVEIEKDIVERDTRDMTREISPLKQAEDAILVDSSEMTIEEVATTICSLFYNVS